MPKTCEECKKEVEPENIGFEMNDLCICKSCFFHDNRDRDYEEFKSILGGE